MGIEIPNLDKKDFDTRFNEAIAKLPSYTNKWTEYNASDPGITIIELLTWLVDINSYKLNRVRKEHYEALIELLKVDEETNTFSKLQEEIFTPYRAVTLNDYEQLLLQNENIAKVKVSADKQNNVIDLIVVPKSKDKEPKLTIKLVKTIKKILKSRVLLTTKVLPKSADYSPININLKVRTKLQSPSDLKKKIALKLEEFLHPVSGGKDKKGWDFGEDIHIVDIYLLLEEIEGIDFIDSISFNKFQAESSFILNENALPISGSHLIEVSNVPLQGSCQ